MHYARSSFPQAFLQTLVVLHKVVLIFISVLSKTHEAGLETELGLWGNLTWAVWAA